MPDDYDGLPEWGNDEYALLFSREDETGDDLEDGFFFEGDDYGNEIEEGEAS